MDKKWILLILLIGVTMLSGCAISNEGMMSYNDAKDTFQKATNAGAKRCAPYQYGRAEAYLALASHEVDERDENSGDFRTAVKIAKEKSLEALNKAVSALVYLAGECKDDLNKYCSNVKPGEGRLIQCLDENRGMLTDWCKTAYGKVVLE